MLINTALTYILLAFVGELVVSIALTIILTLITMIPHTFIGILLRISLIVGYLSILGRVCSF